MDYVDLHKPYYFSQTVEANFFTCNSVVYIKF